MLMNNTPIEKKDAIQYGTLALAYFGDAVYEVMVREMVIIEANMPNGKLHLKATKFVSAKGQSAALDKVYDELTDEEIGVYKRGRNSDAVHGRNVDIAEYKKATGVEALFGFLYLTGQNDRMRYLFGKMTETEF